MNWASITLSHSEAWIKNSNFYFSEDLQFSNNYSYVLAIKTYQKMALAIKCKIPVFLFVPSSMKMVILSPWITKERSEAFSGV